MNKTKTISNQILALEGYLQNFELTNSLVSEVSVGWHIEHSLLTIEKIIYALSISDPKDYHWSFRLPRYIIFTLNKIPRGRAKAPKIVRPSEHITLERLQLLIEQAKSIILKLDNLEPGHFFSHPYFGDLKLKKAIQCIEIHTSHHLKIIRDICDKK